ncbi:MAG: MFS transporter [Pseudomonadota bacterium]|nr:MFS transporter [Alphaproteobacteria bacterium]MDP5012356.1 MFS transporter [Alphaproteobacteria bacterium]MDP5370069.1 MFS transporter [Pseudomonadota bacterium]
MFKSRAIAWSVWMTASIFYAYQYIIRVMPNIMLGDIMTQFNIDAAIFGQFSGVYYIGYSLMHLPIGIMLDRYGPKNVMSGCILLTVIGLLPILFAEHWMYPLIGRFLIGVGSSAAILGAFKIIRMAFDEKYFTRMLSLSVTIGLIGAIYGGGPVSYMCTKLGYKAVVEIFAMLGLALAVVTYIIVPKMESTNHGSVISNVKLVLMNPKVIMICLLAGLMVGPLEGFADVWGAEFLKQVYGYDGTVASYLPSMIFIGMCFGAPVLSLVAEKTGRYVAVITGAGIVMLVTFAALVAKLLTVSTMTIGFVCVGVCCAYQILAIYKASTYVPEHVAGLTTAVANMIIMIFGWVFHTVIGCVINAYGGTKVASAFVYGIGVIPATLAVGVIGFMLIARTDQKVE